MTYNIHDDDTECAVGEEGGRRLDGVKAETNAASKDEYERWDDNDQTSTDPDGVLVSGSVSVDTAIDKVGTGMFQHRVLLAAGLCFTADSMEIMLLSFLSIILRSEWGLTPTQTASITSSVFAGAMTGTLVLGPLGDKWGRRPVFLLAGTIISLFGILTAFATGYATLVAVRFMVGFGVGGLTVPFDTLAEFLPTSTRGRYLLMVEYFWTLGSMSVPVVTYFTIGAGYPWQFFVLICAIPCFVSVAIGLYFVPESPRWLISRGRTAEALTILKSAAAVNGKNPDLLFPEGTHLRDEEEESSRFLDLLKPKWRRLTLLLWGVWAGFAFGYYGTVIAVTRVFHTDESGVSNTDDDAVGSSTPDFDYSAIFVSGSAEVVGLALVINTIDRIGRVPSQVASYSIAGVCLFLLCALSTDANRTVLMSFSFLTRVFEMSGNCVTWVSTAEVLSTEIRTTGHSAANAVARIGGFLSPYLVEGNMSLLQVGFVMLFIHSVTAFCASRLPETKGKALGSRESFTQNDRMSSETERREVVVDNLHTVTENGFA